MIISCIEIGIYNSCYVFILGGMMGDKQRSGCYNCGKEGHMSRECSEKRVGRGGRRGGGKGRRDRESGIHMRGSDFV